MPGINVTVSGPFFQHGGATLEKAITASVREVVAEGETDVALQLYPGHGLKTGHYRRSIHGDMINSRNGTIHDSKVIYGPWLEGTSSRNRSTRFKGYAMFRNAWQGLQRKAPGIFLKHIGRAVKGLN